MNQNTGIWLDLKQKHQCHSGGLLLRRRHFNSAWMAGDAHYTRGYPHNDGSYRSTKKGLHPGGFRLAAATPTDGRASSPVAARGGGCWESASTPHHVAVGGDIRFEHRSDATRAETCPQEHGSFGAGLDRCRPITRGSVDGAMTQLRSFIYTQRSRSQLLPFGPAGIEASPRHDPNRRPSGWCRRLLAKVLRLKARACTRPSVHTCVCALMHMGRWPWPHHLCHDLLSIIRASLPGRESGGLFRPGVLASGFHPGGLPAGAP